MELNSFFCSESFYEHPGKSTKKCCLGLCNWYCNQCYHPESDHYIPKASCQGREENKVERKPSRVKPQEVLEVVNIQVHKCLRCLFFLFKRSLNSRFKGIPRGTAYINA
ncbi:hypothetical protein I3842_Q060300 [Carya illinoinensis]|uniref:Uncharacterized protein n=1 Tax=Carya illinoinensis TaxID=32201 RepID=A0A922A1L8_CARIL|nr:hypothetical protein I3842_Q060300 [Carya illinoinensis]